MENASKAIIMVGAVLIAIIVISIGVFLWRDYSEFSKQSEENRIAQQLDEFNTKFEKYNFTGNNYITAQDVRTIVNYANEYNKKYELQDNDDLKINVKYGKDSILEWKENQWIGFLNDANINGTKYKCTIKTPESKDIVKEITISK